MPSLRHEFLAAVVPRLRRSSDLPDGEEALAAERARLLRRQEGLPHTLPTMLVPFFDRRFDLAAETIGPAEPGGPDFAVWTLTPRRLRGRTTRTVVLLHGGGFMAPVDPFHVRWACRLASGLGASVAIPDYPLIPTHTWRDTVPPVADLVARLAAADPDLVLAGDSAGGGLALAVAQVLRDRGGPQAGTLLLVSPWVDLTMSEPDTPAYDARDPWLFLGKARAYARWWAGSDADLTRPEVSPARGDLRGLPPALMFCGTRDLLLPGARLLARRAAEAGWPLTYVEQPDLLHVYPVLPIVPEADVAWRTMLGFLEPRAAR